MADCDVWSLRGRLATRQEDWATHDDDVDDDGDDAMMTMVMVMVMMKGRPAVDRAPYPSIALHTNRLSKFLK